MNRRNLIKMLSISTLLSVSVSLAFPMSALASETKTMVTVVKEAGVPWFNILNQGLKEGGEKIILKPLWWGPRVPILRSR